MRSRLTLIGLAVCFGQVFSQLPPPENIQTFVASDGALIRFDPVDGAIAYLGVLGATVSSSVESPEPQLYFGDLKALTEYTVFVTAIDGSGVDGEPRVLVFKTGVGRIKNFKVVATSSSLIALEWTPVDGVDSYILDPVEDKTLPPVTLAYMKSTDETPSLPSVRMTSRSTARITNLTPMTYYKITVRALVDNNLGPASTLRTRTDGNGLVLYNIWKTHDGVTLGGTGAIFKPLQNPRGPYTLSINFPCDMKNFEVWEANVDNFSSDPPRMYTVVQKEVWMQEKSEIGFNFYTVYNESLKITCDFDPRNISVQFGSDVKLQEATEEYDISYDFFDWGGGGMVTLNVDDVFRETRQATDEFDTRRQKPDRSKMAIQMTLGENCSTIRIRDCWNVDRVYNVSTEIPDDKSYYFVQTRDMWFTNDIGIVFTYDGKECQDKENFIVSFLSGGDFVESIQRTYEIQEVSMTCSDDPYGDLETLIENESLIFYR